MANQALVKMPTGVFRNYNSPFGPFYSQNTRKGYTLDLATFKIHEFYINSSMRIITSVLS